MKETTRGIFISGRPHCGNTILCRIMANLPSTFADCQEHNWIDQQYQWEAEPGIDGKINFFMKFMDDDLGLSRRKVRRSLETWWKERSETDIYAFLNEALRISTETMDRDCWVMKFTSGIYYADEVLERMPNVRMVYMTRNPFDVVASFYTRTQQGEKLGNRAIRDWLISVLLSWRKGTRKAESLAEKYPDRFFSFRYEDMVRDDEALHELFHRLGMNVTEDALDVEHTNRADKPYEDLPHIKGLNDSRVGRFREVLSPSQQGAARLLLTGSRVDRWYPGLMDRAEGTRTLDRLGGLVHILTCGVHLGNRWVTELARGPMNAVNRALHRFRA